MDTNRIVKIEELEIGDEILFPGSSGQLVYAKVLQKPQESKVGYRWQPGIKRWVSVKCQLNVKKIEIVYGLKNEYKRELVKHHLDGDLPPITVSVNLNFKDMWLVKKADD